MLDSKARLVLPLEIRDTLNVKKNEKILISVSDAKEDKITIEISKPSISDETDSISYSRNGKYVNRRNTETKDKQNEVD
ncbi:MAG: AbrB/MazE/SpoVT family DNA-binding domain-containing protein [Candidatus Micrarchaeota archaeon]